MTLEDFFTVTEIKDGLASIPRVDELVSIMKKEKDDVTKNLGDAARRWVTVGGVLASTERMDCLTQFIQLDGIHFLNLWLQEAQKSAVETNENFVNESVDVILKVLEKLPIETTWPTVSGINVTIENFSKQKGMHQERAQCLLNNWNREFDKCADALENGKQGETCNGDDKIPEDVKENPDESGKEGGTLSGSDILKAKKQSSSAAVSSEQINPMFTGDEETLIPKFDNVNDGSAVSKESVPVGIQLSSLQEAVPSVEESSTCPENTATISEVNNSASPRENGVNNSSCDVSEMKGVIDDKEMEAKPKFEEDISSLLNEQRNICALSETQEKDLYLHGTSSSNSGGKLDKAEPCRDAGANHVSEHSDKLPISPDTISPDRGLDSGTSSDKSSGIIFEKVAGIKGLYHESNMNNSRLLNPMILSEAYKPNLSVNGKYSHVNARSQMDLDEEEDALEVARIVGKEVERELVDYREPSGSFSGKCVEDGNPQPSSLDSVGHDEGGSTLEQLERVEDSDEHRYSDSDSEGSDLSPKAERSRISSAINPEVENLDANSTHSIDLLKESDEQTSKDKCMFDLNEDVLQEETEYQMTTLSNLPSSTLSAPVPVIPVSKGCANIPVSPLHFEGEHGWKGIAATSAFRRAFSRRNANGDRLCLGETNSQNCKRKNNVMKFDLNVVETEEEPVVDHLGKHLPVSCGLLSGESSVEVSSRKAKRPKLDLNRIEDHDEPNALLLPECRVQGREYPQLHQNCNRSPSSASTSSSRQPSTRDFDLNDNPSFFDPSGSLGPTQYSSHDNRSYGSFQLDEPFISVMGSRIEVNRKDLDYQTRIFLPSAPSLEPSTSGNVHRLGRTGVGISYAPDQPLPFSYSGLTMWPAGAFPPPMNSHSIPCMVDSRGASVMPSIMGGTGTSASPVLSRPPFFMSVLGPSPSMIEGAPQSGLDLNAGMGLIEGENQTQEVGGLKHLFVQSHGGLMDEQMKSGLLLGGAGLSLKRKEPERVWEHSMPGYKKHETSWQH